MLACVLAGSVIGGGAALRLGMVVAATPASAWLPEIPMLLQPQTEIDAGTRARAEFAARLIADPMLVLPLLPGCDDSTADAPDACLRVIENGLRAAPYSGELWFGKAVWMLRAGQMDDGLFEALRMSYRTAPKEAWIASGRVVFGLRLYPVLPDDLKASVSRDLDLILDFSSFSELLAEAYGNDTLLRDAAKPALERLTPERLKAFGDKVLARTNAT